MILSSHCLHLFSHPGHFILLSLRSWPQHLQEIFFSDLPSGAWAQSFLVFDMTLIYVSHWPRYNDFICNSATSSRPHVDAAIQGNGSLILSTFVVVCSLLIPNTIRSWIKLSHKQQQTEWHVFARFLSSAAIKTITRLSWELLWHMKTVSFVNFVTLAAALFLCVVHDNYALIIWDAPFGEIKCFDDKQSIISYHMNEYQW